LAGWSSNSNYSLLGALRSAAQMISYEVSIGIILISIFVNVGSFSLIDVVLAQQKCWFVFSNFPAFVMFFISALAETNRAPFDLPEAEAELVSGYNVEYSGMSFALFFLAEYANIIFMSFLTIIFFFGGEYAFLNFALLPGIEPQIYYTIKVFFIMFLFVWVRVTLPRLRYDQLMIMGWKYILPLSLGILVLTTAIFTSLDAF
jgi:NADH-quinone oxidoreductase subunit H